MEKYPPHKKPKNFTLVLFQSGRELERFETHSRHRFTHKVNSLPENFSAYIRVSYINFGPNWGEYITKKDLVCMYKAFIWEEVWDDNGND